MPRAALTGSVPQRGFIFASQRPIAVAKFIKSGRGDAAICSYRRHQRQVPLQRGPEKCKKCIV